MNRLRVTLALAFLMAARHTAAPGEVSAEPVSQGSGPLRELSTNAGAGSGSVHDSVGSGANAGRLSGNSVRGSVTGDVVSGPVSEISVGGATSSRAVTGGGAVTHSSVGAVKKDRASPLGEMISQPLRELGPLQDQLRTLQPLPRTDSVPDEAIAQEEDLEAPAEGTAGDEPHQAEPADDDASTEQDAEAAAPDADDADRVEELDAEDEAALPELLPATPSPPAQP